MKTLSIALLLAAAVGCASETSKTPIAAAPAKPIVVDPREGHEEPTDRVTLAEPPADVERTRSGLMSKVLVPGTHPDKPGPTSIVRVHYTGWTKDGRVFDSSRQRGEPTEFPLDRVIAGWTEGVQLMTVGEERRFWIPAELAYGNSPEGSSPSGQLTFDIELLGILTKSNIPPVPEDVAAPPPEAIRTASGLAYKVLAPHEGKRPGLRDVVHLEYTGWSVTGTMFQSSLSNVDGQVMMSLDRAMKGWQEGIQLMHVGESVRFWVPEQLAFGAHPPHGIPPGMLVFDIRLVAVDD